MNSGDGFLVFGAGCIGRGLLGELAARAGRAVVFVESDPALAIELRESSGYTVHLVGGEVGATEVHDYCVVGPRGGEALGQAVAGCAFAATAVGGRNLGHVAAVLAPCLERRTDPLNVLVCENWPHADRLLWSELRRRGARADLFACVPASVERMVRRVPGGLDLMGESGETLYAHSTRWKGNPPDLPGLILCEDIEPYYARKLHTNNAGHAVLAYEGHLAGYGMLCDAHADPCIRARLDDLLAPAAEMLSREYGMDRRELAAHVTALRERRFANRALADTVARVARDPLRKLGPEERLVGQLRLLEAHGLPIGAVCRTIAAAMHYFSPHDEESMELQRRLDRCGVGAVLGQHCHIRADTEAHRLCAAEFGCIHSAGHGALRSNGRGAST